MEQDKQMKIKERVAILIAATFLFIGCTSEADGRGNSEEAVTISAESCIIERDHTADLDIRFSEDEMILSLVEETQFWEDISVTTSFGIVASISESEMEATDYGSLQLSGSDDLLVASVVNTSNEDFYYVFKVFVDYEEVPFRLEGGVEYITELFFFLERGQEVEIVFGLDMELAEENVTHKLTAGVFVDPCRQVISEDNYRDFDQRSMVLNNDLIFGSGNPTDLSVSPVFEVSLREEDDQFVDLFIAPELRLNDDGFYRMPDFVVQARRGEPIDLSFIVSPYARGASEVENYLIIGMLNWQQIELSGQPFLFVDASEHDFDFIRDYGTFVLEGIDEVGFYDFTAILIPNPTDPVTFSNSIPLAMSNRFVIHVID